MSSRTGDLAEPCRANPAELDVEDKDQSFAPIPVLEFATLPQSMPERKAILARALTHSANAASVRCNRCARTMALVTTIAAVGKQPGLNAYICPTCGHADSRLLVRRI
jgi:hypothetical protein